MLDLVILTRQYKIKIVSYGLKYYLLHVEDLIGLAPCTVNYEIMLA